MKNFIKLLSILAVIVFLSLFINKNRWNLLESPFSSTIALNDPSYSITDSGNNFYTIDNSRRRILKFSSDGVLEFIINGGSRSKGRFFYANNITVDDEGNLYIFNEITDNGGFYVIREEILKYNPRGRFLNIFHARDYAEKTSTLVQRGRFKKLKFKDGKITWFEINENTINYYERSAAAAEAESLTEKKVSYTEADIFLSYIVEKNPETWIAVTKKGAIEKINPDLKTIEVLYQASGNDVSALSVPWNVDADTTGKIYFSDIGDKSIKLLSEGNKTVLSDSILAESGNEFEGMTYYTLSIIQNVISTCNDYAAISLNTDSGKFKAVSEIQLPLYFMIMKIMTFISIILIIIFFIIFMLFIYRKIFKNHLPAVIFNVILISIIISITTFLISSILFKNFSERYINTVTDKTSQMVQLFAGSTNAGLFEGINSQSDFMNDNYRKIRTAMHEALNNNKDSWNDRYYFVLYRVFNDSLYGMMYLNDGITPFHPFSYFDDMEGAYRKAYAGSITAETDSDTWGTWIYSVGPVYNSEGKVVALLEVGTDLYSYNVENTRLFKNLIIEVLTLIIVLLFIIVELIFFNDLIHKKNSNDRRRSGYAESYILRPINFLFTLGISMSVAFVPVMMKNQFMAEEVYKPLLNLSKEMVIAIPISLEMLFFVTGILIAGELSHRGKWKIILFPGALIAAAGLLLSGISSNMYMFFAARSITGLGSGLVLIGLRTVISTEKDDLNKSQAYSHFYSGAMAGLNVGVFFGAYLADQIGFSSVFYIAFFVIVISVIIMKLFLGGIRPAAPAAPAAGKVKYSFYKFLIHPKIIFYFIMIIIPTYTAGMFLIYYFPMFADSAGISVADIGKFFILNGIFIIYLGPFLSKYIIKFAGVRKSVIFGSFGWAVSLAVFAATGSIYGAVSAIILMGITEGFCVTAQNDFYLGLDIVKKTGEEKSIAYFEVAAKFSEIIAPLIFGSLLYFGQRKGIMYISGGIVLLTVVYILYATTGSKRKSAGKYE
ncbi:MAG: MFS transporter [Spirochaetes bacterium]|nr:MFS transporter [Spirochaetota bacterium]